MITEQEYLMGRDQEYPLTPELKANMAKLLTNLNKLRRIYGKPMQVTSGYRPGHYNTSAKGAKSSNHMRCLACDFLDMDGELAKWCMDNLNVLQDCGLYMENPTHTHRPGAGWVHLQCVMPVSGKRVFIP